MLLVMRCCRRAHEADEQVARAASRRTHRAALPIGLARKTGRQAAGFAWDLDPIAVGIGFSDDRTTVDRNIQHCA
jgi:hypothetical protein